METIRIRKLNIEPLKYNDFALDIYLRDFDFQYLQHKEGLYKNIPVRRDVSLFIEENKNKENLIYPWSDYAEGFISKYKIGMPNPFIQDDESRKWYIMNCIKISTPISLSYNKDKAFEYGEDIAHSYLSWEIIIRDLPTYEALFKNAINKCNFSDYLIHEIAVKLGSKLSPLIKQSKGTEIGLYMLALREMNIINLIKKQPIYDSLELNHSQCNGANDTISKHERKSPDRSIEINAYKIKIQSIIDDLKKQVV